MLKQCSIKTGCSQYKLLTEFNKQKSTKDGYATICKECNKLRYEKWKNSQTKENYNKRQQESTKVWYIKNREKDLKYQKQWRIRNKDKCYSNNALYRQRKYSNYETLSSKDKYLIECVYAFARFKTLHTGVQQHVDHIIPISKGGKHHPSNLQIITALENFKKKDKL